MLKTTIFVCLLIFGKLVFSQDPAFFNIGEVDLRNTNVYSVLLDEDSDLLYVTSNEGVFKYTHGQFTKIPTSEVAIGTSFFDLKKHPQTGQIFCSNFNGQVFTVSQDSVQIYFEDKGEIGRSFQFYFQNDRLITLSSISIHFLTEYGQDTATVFLNDRLQPESKLDFYNVKQLNSGVILFTNSVDKICYEIRNGNVAVTDRVSLINRNINISYLSFDECDIVIDESGLMTCWQDTLNADFTVELKEQFFRMNENQLLGVSPNQGVRVLKFENDSIKEIDRFLMNRKFSTAFVSETGVLYLGTFGEGITIIPNFKKRRAVFNAYFQSIAVSNQNRAFLLTNNNELFEPKRQQLVLQGQLGKDEERIHYVNGHFDHDNGVDSGLVMDSKRTKFPLRDIFQKDSNSYFGVKFGSVFLQQNRFSTPIPNLAHYGYSDVNDYYILTQLDRFTAVAWSAKDSLVYYAANSGVYFRKLTDLNLGKLEFKGKSFMSNDLEIYKDWVICGTKKQGVLFYKDGQVVGQVNENEGLHSELVKKLKILDHYLIILTKADLQILDLDNRTFLNVGPMDGFYPKEVIDFAVSNDQLWILEKHAFYNISVNRLQKENNVGELFIESVNFNGKAQDYLHNSTYKHYQNNFSIVFDYRNILTRAEAEIYYKLLGFDLHWNKTRAIENEIYYPYLATGDYKLKMYVKYGNNATKPFVYSFTIQSPFWEQWWFYVITISIIFGIGWFLYRLRLNFLTRKLRIKNELDNSKLTAIRSQMNPHFIFNALNSIQHLVIKGDTENSYTYINKFASLVRKTLDYSEIESISIAEEISLIEVYLSLEKLRFKDSFDYHIIAPKNIALHIPAMLLQPFIENAIVHGLLHKPGQKRLTIRFKLKDHLLCIIEDNGVGRERSREIKQRQTGSHESFSMNAIKKRFDILNNYYHTDLGFEFEDFEPKDDLDTVTRVTVRIPINVGH